MSNCNHEGTRCGDGQCTREWKKRVQGGDECQG